ncbi:MAG: coproporphyrinogen dehydrogenase HemZ [Lachnospiraceae bacterium]|nr:coproporphyrinogen dehydrogenase HemZ [Lachnospiraceae bacterium]
MLSLEINNTTDRKQEHYENEIKWLLKAFFKNEEIAAGSSDAGIRITADLNAGTVGIKIEGPDGERESLCSTWDIKDDSAAKDIMKRTVYGACSAFTGKKLPWGTLTGIRPVKRMTSLMEQGLTEEQLYEKYREEYFISDGKFRLCYETAVNENRILSGLDYKNEYSFYAGVPFCRTICEYCSFASSPIAPYRKRIGEFLDAFEKEAEAISEMMKGRRMTTAYVGGGTPVSLDTEDLRRFLTTLTGNFDIAGTREFTVEAGRADSIDEEKLAVLKDFGVNRISINPQTMNDATLRRIGRDHTAQQVRDAFHLARSMGFDNINMDTIIGLSGETADDVKYTMDEIIKLSPDSLTVHSLAVKRAARLNTEGDFRQETDASVTERMMSIAADAAERMGMKPYYLYRQKNMAGEQENTGYAVYGKECLYNILMMEEKQDIIALSCSGSTKLMNGDQITRVENVKSVKDYIERIDEMIGRKREVLAGRY